MDSTATLLLVFGALQLSGAVITVQHSQRTFEIDYEHDQFLKDGSPFRYVSGSLHYFRVPRALWRDRMRKCRAAGLNAISTYVEWSSHERLPGEYDFSGQNDLEEFLRLAQKEDLLVILRPGPYICAERDLVSLPDKGGYPAWIFNENPDIVLRTNDSSHTRLVYGWFQELFPRIEPLLYGNGGPIIMVQVENEYGSYFACDRNYTLWLRDVLRSYVGENAVLFTTDGWEEHYLKCGPIAGVFATVDFGVCKNASAMFDPLRALQPCGPLVNSEFYTGHLTHWGDARFSTVSIEDIVNTTDQLMRLGASFNYYMFHGGTNFGLSSGANNPPFEPVITSYDFDAPISEGGNLTEKYYAIKSVISEYLPIPNETVNHSHSCDYGKVPLEAGISLWDRTGGAKPYGVFPLPQTMESLQQYSGMLLYETVLPADFSGTGLLEVEVHDRAIVYLDKEPLAVLSRTTCPYTLNLTGNPGQTLALLVENQGHINYGNMSDIKGIVSNATLKGGVLVTWNHTGFPLASVPCMAVADLSDVPSGKLPAYFSGRFDLPKKMAVPEDTFVDMTGWGKGVVYVNGFSLGRHWPLVGPQVSLYLPASLLTSQRNTIVVLELESAPANPSVQLKRKPVAREADCDDQTEQPVSVQIVH